jgi:hypothetical protein
MSHQQHQTCCWWCSSSLVSEHLALFLQIGNFEEMIGKKRILVGSIDYSIVLFFFFSSRFFKKRRGRLATSCVRLTDWLHFFTGLPLYGPIKFSRINHRSDASKAQRLPSETSDEHRTIQLQQQQSTTTTTTRQLGNDN